MEGARPAPLALRLFLLAALPAAGWWATGAPELPQPPSRAPQDSIRVNVTTLKDDGEVSNAQVVLNITYEAGQVYVNDLPVNSGVTRISCQTLIVKNESLGNLEEKEYFGIVTVRVLVHEWPKASGSSLRLLIIQEEVVELDGRQAQQKDVTEVDILVRNQRMLRQARSSLRVEESMLHALSRDSDTLFTLPGLSRKGEGVSPLQTTSQYLTGNMETTVEGEALPGKLPETPLRAEPPSSYKVMCQWMEDFRRALCSFWSSVLPLFFMLLNVMLVGVIGAAVVITILKVLCPVFDYNKFSTGFAVYFIGGVILRMPFFIMKIKGILQLDQVDIIPVTVVSLYPDGPEKKAENLEDKACPEAIIANHGL